MNLVVFITYGANRVQFIYEYTTPSQGHYVEIALNTADKGSRGMSSKDFMEDRSRVLTS